MLLKDCTTNARLVKLSLFQLWRCIGNLVLLYQLIVVDYAFIAFFSSLQTPKILFRSSFFRDANKVYMGKNLLNTDIKFVRN